MISFIINKFNGRNAVFEIVSNTGQIQQTPITRMKPVCKNWFSLSFSFIRIVMENNCRPSLECFFCKPDILWHVSQHLAPDLAILPVMFSQCRCPWLFHGFAVLFFSVEQFRFYSYKKGFNFSGRTEDRD